MALALVSGPTEILGESGGVRWSTAGITPDTSYPTGGSAGVTALLGFGKILALIPASTFGYEWEYNPATDKLKVCNSSVSGVTGPGTEVANATNLSALGTLNVIVLGTD